MRAGRLRGLSMACVGLPACALALACAPFAADAQQVPPDTAGPVSPDSAHAIRAALVRPPGGHPFDALDAVALPFRALSLPVVLVGRGLAAGIDLATTTGPPPFYVMALRDAREWGLRPDVASLGPRSGPALAVELARWEPLYLSSALSWRGSQDHRAGARWSGGGVSADLGVFFHRDAEPRFWGVGSRTDSSARTDFRHDRIGGRLETGWRATRHLSVRLAAGYEENEVGGGSDAASPDIGERFTDAELFGLGERTRFFRLVPGVELDLVRRVGFQLRGLRLDASGAVYRGAGPTEADFHRLAASADGYLPLNRRQLLFLRAAAELNRGDDGRGVPFTHLASLGDHVGGRGYQDGRFRDRDLLALTAEWRYEIWRELQSRMRMEGFVFFEEGAVAHTLGSLESSDFRPSWGVGLRLVEREGALGRAFVAVGEEGTRWQLDLSATVP